MTESILSATAAPFVSQELSTEDAQGRLTQSTTNASRAAELASAKIQLNSALRHFPDFPIKGIDFVDILPLFADPAIHETLLHALHLEVLENINPKPDVIVALDARGFLFGPGLALRLGCPFAPVRKQGKLPGPCATTSYKKEYGEDFFQMQQDAVKPGQAVLIVDDIIATGGSAQAAGKLVEQLGGKVINYLFILELDFLKGRDILNAPTVTLLAQEEKQ